MNKRVQIPTRKELAMRPYEEFYNADTGEFTAEFIAFEQAVADTGCPNFDCNLVALAIKAGWTPEQASETFNAWYDEDRGEKIDWLDQEVAAR